MGTWVGSIIYLSFVVAPGAFGVLQSRDQAGLMVGYSLARLHYMGMVAAVHWDSLGFEERAATLEDVSALRHKHRRRAHPAPSGSPVEARAANRTSPAGLAPPRALRTAPGCSPARDPRLRGPRVACLRPAVFLLLRGVPMPEIHGGYRRECTVGARFVAGPPPALAILYARLDRNGRRTKGLR